MERKCMICGAELGEREKYCGNCGTKAPDGAVDKKEVEPKYILDKKPHEPQMDYTWKAQDFFCKQGWVHGRYRGPWVSSNFSFLLCRYYIYFTMIITLVLSNFFVDIQNINLFVLLELCIHVLFFIYCISINCVYKICDNLMKFKKDAPQLLYIHCGIRILAFPSYAIFLAMTNMFHPIIGWVALIEGTAGLAALIISIKYYEKRRNAFIN